ncbi:MAG: DUF4258 domain-containing protein [Melioribacteraceae bacterium]
MDEDITKKIKKLVELDKISFKKHALIRIVERKIRIEEIEFVLKDCKIIEEYPLDKPQKSYLVSVVTSVYRPLHIVDAIDKKIDYLLIITAYEPDKKKWDKNFNRRI